MLSNKNVQDQLYDLYQYQDCVLTGSGTAALWLACQLISSDREQVILPAIVCPNVVYAVILAGKSPLFVDVGEDANLNPEAVSRCLARSPRVGAIIAVHLFGHRADLSSLRVLANKAGCLLIEDAAQAMGVIAPDIGLTSSRADFLVVSFGHTKILDVGGGGALLAATNTLGAKAKTIAAKLSLSKGGRDQLAEHYRKLYYAIVDASDTDARFTQLFSLFPYLFRELYLYKPSLEMIHEIGKALPTLAEKLKGRACRAAQYRDELSDIDGVRFFLVSEGSVYWRFSFCVDRELRSGLLNAVRKVGFDASSWYPCIAPWFATETFRGDNEWPVARRIAAEVCNFWVTEDYDPIKITELCNVVRYFFQDN